MSPSSITSLCVGEVIYNESRVIQQWVVVLGFGDNYDPGRILYLCCTATNVSVVRGLSRRFVARRFRRSVSAVFCGRPAVSFGKYWSTYPDSARAGPSVSPFRTDSPVLGSAHLEFYVITCCSSKRNTLVRFRCSDVFRNSDETARFASLSWTQPLWLRFFSQNGW